MSTELKIIKHPNSASLVRYEQAGVTYEPTDFTTPSDLAILQAVNGRKVSECKDAELDAVLIKSINTAVLLLGQKNQWKDELDQRPLVNELYRMIRQKYSYYTLEEVELIFRLGSRGELKVKQTDVVFLNIEQVSSWFRVYKNDCKAKAISNCRRIEESKPKTNYDPKNMLREALGLMANKQDLPPTMLTLLQACYYDKFEKAGLIQLSLEEKKQIHLEEREKELERTKADASNRGPEKRFAYRLFKEAVQKLAPLSNDNPFERRVRGNCRERVFKQTLQELAWTDTDVETLEL
ncbi:hypothetical protein [Pontibacter rugosus]|uniref:Uncharacterized protein n=1 Tax=Pontibacter rugosus TaxID=1745966 RepID=A0ABW3SKZ9_9BACT